jgi:hypothetical protein
MGFKRSVFVFSSLLLICPTPVVIADTPAPSADITAVVKAPAVVFRDQDLSGTLTLTHKGKIAQPGALYIKYTGRKNFTTLLDGAWDAAPGKSKEYPLTLPCFNYDGQGGKTLQILYRDPQGHDTILATHSFTVLFQRYHRPGENLLVNSGFELPSNFCGGGLGMVDEEMRSLQWENVPIWTSLDFDGWWARGPHREGIELAAEARTGKKCLRLTTAQGTVGVTSAMGYYVPQGPITLSVYVKTQNVKGSLTLDLVADMGEARGGRAVARKSVNLPTNAAEWTRVCLTLDCPQTIQFQARFDISQGTALFDDIQVEQCSSPTPFNVRPQEFLRLSFDGREESEMPKWTLSDPAKHTIRVHNDSRLPLTGKIALNFGPWNIPDLNLIGEFDARVLPPGQSKTLEFSTASLRADAYVLAVQLKDRDRIVSDGTWDFDPYAFVAFGIQNILHSRSVARFVVVPRTAPKKLYGIGNTTMRKFSDGFPISYIDYHLNIRDIAMSCTRGGCGDDDCFMNAAAGGVPIFTWATFDSAPADRTFTNPCAPDKIDVYSEKGRQFLKTSGESMGRSLAANPMVVGVQLANEQYWANGGTPCPTRAADADFRAWCKTVHKSLKVLNERWGTKYSTWDQVDQVLSERFYKYLLAAHKKEGPASFNWETLHWNLWPQEAITEMNRLPGKTMDWLRWRTVTGVQAYKTFRQAAQIHDQKTLYSTDLPIPTFRKEFFFPFVRAMDAAMINSRYTDGYDISYSTPHEHMSDLELTESLAQAEGKPFWGIEIYHEPSWPPASAALQNWGLIAHGMQNTLIFSWYPFSDTGVPRQILDWTKRTGDPHCWYMIDVDGARLPAYDYYVRSLKEVSRYHERFDGLSIKRAATDIAYYISNDTCEQALFATLYKPWGALSERVSCTLIFLLRLNGLTADFVDDASLPDSPGKFRTILIPLARVLSQPAAEKIAKFANQGGTVVLIGPAGQLDPWLKSYSNLGGPAWAEINWQIPQYQEEFGRYVFDDKIPLPNSPPRSASDTAGKQNEKKDDRLTENSLFRGVSIGTIPGAQPINDAKNTTVGWQRPWGKGKLIAYGICPDTFCKDPHPSPHLTAWTRQLINLADLKSAGRWTTLTADTPNGFKVGTGTPVVDLVVREKSPNEKFIFCLNQGGKGKGLVEIPVSPGVWRAEDVIDTEKSITGTIENTRWKTQISLDPWGYRIIRLFKTQP